MVRKMLILPQVEHCRKFCDENRFYACADSVVIPRFKANIMLVGEPVFACGADIMLFRLFLATRNEVSNHKKSKSFQTQIRV